MVSIAASTKIHAFTLAEQMEKHGLLDKLFTSYAYAKNTFARKFIKRIDREEIPVSKIQTNLLLAFPIGMFRTKAHVWNALFDKWVAAELKKSQSRVFIGWSGMSINSIQAAGKMGMKTIVERGSSHILYQEQILKEEYKRFQQDFFIPKSVIKRELAEYETADYISVPSYFVKNSFIEKGVPEEKIFLNAYGANSDFKPAEAAQKTDNVFRIVYLGTVSIRKGLIYFFEALQQLKIPAQAFEVIIIGSIHQEMEAVLAKYKMDNWKIMGHINYYELPAILAGFDIAVQPSLEEGLSMVIPQMMACGLPVIITPNTGGENILTDGENGFVVPIRDSRAIAEKLSWAYTHPEELSVMKKKAATIISRQFTSIAYGDRYSDFIKKISS